MKRLFALAALLLCQPLGIARDIATPVKHVVALDIGHTPAHPGAISASGIPEYEFNKAVVEKINSALSATSNVEPYIVTSSDTLTLQGRTRLAAAHRAELFIAIHHDSVQDKYLHSWEVDGQPQQYADEFSGYGVFFSRKNTESEASLEFARLLGEQMAARGFHFSRHHAEPIRGENREIVDDEAGVYRFDNLIVLRTAQMPAVLLECGVIVNRVEEKLLLTSERQQKIADAVAAAVKQFFSTPGRLIHSPAAATTPVASVIGPKLTPMPSVTTTRPRSLLQRVFSKRQTGISATPSPVPPRATKSASPSDDEAEEP